jgi:hypothetical protein
MFIGMVKNMDIEGLCLELLEAEEEAELEALAMEAKEELELLDMESDGE